MTTKEAAALYEAEHIARYAGLGWEVYNPNNKPLQELPVIYGFNNGGSPGWYEGILLSEDGVCLGGHLCSSEGYMPHDLGILSGTRPDRHVGFREHYPEGYKMEFIGHVNIKSHEGLTAAIAKYRQREKSGEQ